VLRNRWLLDDRNHELDDCIASHENPVGVVLQFILAQLAAVPVSTYDTAWPHKRNVQHTYRSEGLKLSFLVTKYLYNDGDIT